MSNVIQLHAVEATETFTPSDMQIRAHIQHVLPAFCEESVLIDLEHIEEEFVAFYYEISGLEIDDVIDALDLTGDEDFKNPALFREFNRMSTLRKNNKIRDAKAKANFANILYRQAKEANNDDGSLRDTIISEASAGCAEYAFTDSKKFKTGSVRSDLYEGMGDALLNRSHAFSWEAMRKMGELNLPENECDCPECSAAE